MQETFLGQCWRHLEENMETSLSWGFRNSERPLGFGFPLPVDANKLQAKRWMSRGHGLVSLCRYLEEHRKTRSVGIYTHRFYFNWHLLKNQNLQRTHEKKKHWVSRSRHRRFQTLEMTEYERKKTTWKSWGKKQMPSKKSQVDFPNQPTNKKKP